MNLLSKLLKLLPLALLVVGIHSAKADYPRGFYRTSNGAIYYFNDYNHACVFRNMDEFYRAGGTNGGWQNLGYSLTSNVYYDGYCYGGSYPQPQPQPQPPTNYSRGNYRTPDGAIYFFNGSGAACSFSSWEHFLRSQGSNATWTEIARFPRRLRYDGICR
jgi:hypothetical protein